MAKRKVIAVLSVLFFALAEISGAVPSVAQEIPTNDAAAHDALIALYFKSAFASRDQLLKPIQPAPISYHCDLEFCQQVLMELKSDFPSGTQQNTISSSLISANEVVSVRFFSDGKSADEASSKLAPQTGEQSSTLNFLNCNLTRFVRRNAVTRVIVDVAQTTDIKANVVCALFEVARGTGLDARQSYPEYSKEVLMQGDRDYARFTLGIRNVLNLHWSPKTEPGMTRTQVNEALGSVFVKKNN